MKRKCQALFFRKLNARGKIFIEYEPLETAWIPISGKNYEYIYCLWVAGSFKGKGIGKELLEYAINDSKEKGKSGICTLVSKKKKPFIGEKKFFEHYGFKVVDTIGDYELLALQFDDSETPRFNDSARLMKIDNKDFTIYYSPECPYVEYEVNELIEYAKENRAEDTLYKEMKMLSRNLSAFPNLKEALSNPVLNIREKYSLICAAATGDQGVSRTFSRFITLVLKNNREQFLQFICLSFLDLYRKLKHIGVGKLITAVPVDKETEERIRNSAGAILHAQMELETVVDPSIEGGFVFDINDYRLDASIATQLKRVKQQFIDKNRRIV